MQIAVYTDESGRAETLRAEPFQDDKELAKKRKRLKCVGCGIKAAFRRKAINGKAPHFAASHVAGCNIPDDDETEIFEATELKSAKELRNESGLIEINLSFGSQKNAHGVEPDPDKPSLTGETRTRKKHVRSNSAGNSIWRRRLSTLLKTLFEDSSFSESEQLMLMPNGKQFKARSVFYPIEAVENFKEDGKYPAFYFGVIDSAVLSKNTLWLNTGSLDGTSIRINNDTTIKTLFDRYKLEVDSDGYDEIGLLAGVQFLVFGLFNRAKSTRKCIISPEVEFNANAICFRKQAKK